MTSREAFFLLPKLFSTDCWRRSWSSSSIHLALEKTLPKESKEKTCHLRSNFGRCTTSRKISVQMMTRREQEPRAHRLLNNVFADPVAGAGYLTRGQTPGRLWLFLDQMNIWNRTSNVLRETSMMALVYNRHMADSCPIDLDHIWTMHMLYFWKALDTRMSKMILRVVKWVLDIIPHG